MIYSTAEREYLNRYGRSFGTSLVRGHCCFQYSHSSVLMARATTVMTPVRIMIMRIFKYIVRIHQREREFSYDFMNLAMMASLHLGTP